MCSSKSHFTVNYNFWLLQMIMEALVWQSVAICQIHSHWYASDTRCSGTHFGARPKRRRRALQSTVYLAARDTHRVPSSRLISLAGFSHLFLRRPNSLFAAQKEECGVRKLLLNDGARSRAPEQLFTDEAGGWVGGRCSWGQRLTFH